MSFICIILNIEEGRLIRSVHLAFTTVSNICYDCRVPLWPFIKLVGTFWLVIPQFNGACYAYDCLVNADLSAKLHCFLSQFSHGLCAQEQLVC